MSRGVSPTQYNSFEDWLRMEDAVTRREQVTGTLTGADLGLQVICEDDTWEYIREKCERFAGRTQKVNLDLSNCLVCAFWTCPTFWELVRSNVVSTISFYADDEDRTGAKLIANLTAMTDLYNQKVTLLSRLYAEEMTEDTANILMKKCDDGYALYLADAFGASGVMSIADFLLIEKSVRALKSRIADDEIIHIDLRPYDIGMVVDRVSELALDDRVAIEVHGTFLSMILREMAKLREKHSGLPYEDYAIQELPKMVGKVGLLQYEKMSRGFCLPAKLVGFTGATAVFDVISPINGSCTDYRKFEVSVTLPHLSVDDVLAKRSGFHVFISERFLSEDFVANILHKGFPDE